MDLGLVGKVALVTASSQGLGAAVASLFAQEGAQVVICSRDKGRIEKRATLIRQETGVDVRPVVADVTRADDVENLVHTTIAEYGRLDILITNAGGPPAARTLSISLQRISRLHSRLI